MAKSVAVAPPTHTATPSKGLSGSPFTMRPDRE
jgi:hypothetical protein